jgi:hypothetical protein
MSYATIHIDESVVIERPPPDVWAAIADYAVDLQWRDGLIEMTPTPPGPAAVGTEVREALRRAGRTYTATAVVDRVEPGIRYHFAGQGTSGRISGRREVRPGPTLNSTSFTYAVDIHPPMPLRLVAPLVARVARSAMRRDLQSLKVLLEATSPEADSSGAAAAALGTEAVPSGALKRT